MQEIRHMVWLSYAYQATAHFLFYGSLCPSGNLDPRMGSKQTKPVLPELPSFQEDRRPPLIGQQHSPAGCMLTELYWSPLREGTLSSLSVVLFYKLFILPIKIWWALEHLAQWCYPSSHHSGIRESYRLSEDPGLRSNYFLRVSSKRIYEIILTSHILRKGFQKQKIICGVLKLFKFCFSVGRCVVLPHPNFAKYFWVFLWVYQIMPAML